MAAPEAIKRFIREGKKKGHLKPKYQNMTDEELEAWLDSDLPEEEVNGALSQGMNKEFVKKFILEGKRKGQLRPKYQNMTEEELLEDLERDYQEDNPGELSPGKAEEQ